MFVGGRRLNKPSGFEQVWSLIDGSERQYGIVVMSGCMVWYYKSEWQYGIAVVSGNMVSWI